MSLEVDAADFVLGTLAAHELPAACERAMCEGRESRSLAMLAGVTSVTYDRWEVEDLWHRALRELKIEIPSKAEATRIIVRDAATRALRGEIPAERALARTVRGAYYGSGAAARDSKIAGDSLDLGTLVGLYYEYDEVDQEWSRSAEELDQEILTEFRELLTRWPPN